MCFGFWVLGRHYFLTTRSLSPPRPPNDLSSIMPRPLPCTTPSSFPTSNSPHLPRLTSLACLPRPPSCPVATVLHDRERTLLQPQPQHAIACPFQHFITLAGTPLPLPPLTRPWPHAPTCVTPKQTRSPVDEQKKKLFTSPAGSGNAGAGAIEPAPSITEEYVVFQAPLLDRVHSRMYHIHKAPRGRQNAAFRLIGQGPSAVC